MLTNAIVETIVLRNGDKALRVAVDSLMDPVDVCRDARDNTLRTGIVAKTIDADSRPSVLLISTRQWTSAITLLTQQRSMCIPQSDKLF